MQIAPATSTRLTPLPPAGEHPSAGSQPPVVPSGRQAAAQAPLAASDAAGGKEDWVSLSTADREGVPADDAAAVFAEIWKDGQKLAAVDSHGRVISWSGLVPPAEGASTNGLLLAPMRAARVAQAVGGEIRVAGQALDGDTLVMRARLARTYGATL